MKTNTKTNKFDDDTYMEVDLPKANLVLFFGIGSIVGCFLFGIVGTILGLIARKISSKPMDLYKIAPELYTKSSYRNVKSGRICALIGIILSSITFIFILLFWAFREMFLSIF